MAVAVNATFPWPQHCPVFWSAVWLRALYSLAGVSADWAALPADDCDTLWSTLGDLADHVRAWVLVSW